MHDYGDDQAQLAMVVPISATQSVAEARKLRDARQWRSRRRLRRAQGRALETLLDEELIARQLYEPQEPYDNGGSSTAGAVHT